MSSEIHKGELKQEIDLLVDFVNTRDVEEGTDSIDDPAKLGEWIAEHTGEYLPQLDDRDVQRLARQHVLDLPYHLAIYRVLFEGADPRDVLEVLR